jgi:oligopeptide/dipeptide ABC transporter ATP-binding protein
MPNPILEIRDLVKDFPAGSISGKQTRVVDHVSTAVAPGEIRGIVGESGSGKTTLARCSLRLLEPSSGGTCFDGQNLADLSRAELRNARREFQMVFQDPYSSLNPSMTVEDILLEPLQIHGVGSPEERRERMRELIAAVSLDEAWMKRRPAELSGGQQQRVGIARALALKPRLLIADEPVSALDVSVQAQILNLLSDLKQRYALTLILISHSLYVVHYLCTHISVMYCGRIVEEAPAAAFFGGPRHPYSRMLLEAMPVLDPSGQKSIRAGKENLGSAQGAGSGCAFYPHCLQRLSICAERAPELEEVASGESVACFLYKPFKKERPRN